MADPGLIALAGLAFLVAGFVKGVAGMGLPTTALGLMTLAIDPRSAIALILFPMIATNSWQAVAAGHLRRSWARYRPFAVVLVAGVAVTTFSTAKAADGVLLAALGLVLLLFVWFTWAGWIPRLPDRFDRAGQAAFGAFAGIIGGLTASWAAPIAMYLTARGTGKDEFIRATGFLIFIGSLPLCLSYAGLGFLTGPLALASGLMLVPAFGGMWLGARLRSRLSGEAFRNAILIVFVALALNLLRRALA